MGGGWNICADKLFISTRLGGALAYAEQLLKYIIYLMLNRPKNIYFKTTPATLPPGDWMVVPLTCMYLMYFLTNYVKNASFYFIFIMTKYISIYELFKFCMLRYTVSTFRPIPRDSVITVGTLVSCMDKVNRTRTWHKQRCSGSQDLHMSTCSRAGQHNKVSASS